MKRSLMTVAAALLTFGCGGAWGGLGEPPQPVDILVDVTVQDAKEVSGSVWIRAASMDCPDAPDVKRVTLGEVELLPVRDTQPPLDFRTQVPVNEDRVGCGAPADLGFLFPEGGTPPEDGVLRLQLRGADLEIDVVVAPVTGDWKLLPPANLNELSQLTFEKGGGFTARDATLTLVDRAVPTRRGTAKLERETAGALVFGPFEGLDPAADAPFELELALSPEIGLSQSSCQGLGCGVLRSSVHHTYRFETDGSGKFLDANE